MKRTIKNNLLSMPACSVLAITMAAFTGTAIAQEEPAVTEVAEDEQATMNTVTVMARKREESLQEVPVSISVFTGDQLKEAAITSTRDLYAETPGLNYDTGFDQNAATPAIRGVTSREIATYRQKVTTFLDGMPILGQQGTVPFLAIQQVEVLRGPQSAAFGRSTFGGAINYTTRDPGDEFEAEVNVDVGSNNLLSLNGLVAGPIIADKLGGLIAVSDRSIDGDDDWVTVEEGITLGGESATNLLAKLVFTPTDQLSIEARYKFLESDNEQTARAFYPLDHPSRVEHPDRVFAPAGPGSLPCGPGVPVPSCAFVGEVAGFNQVYDYNYAATGIDDPFVRNERDRFEVEVNYDFANDYSLQALGFTSEEYYERATDSDLSNNAAGFERDPTNIEETYYEVRLTSPGDDRFRWGVGDSLYDYDFLTEIYRNAAGFAAETGARRISETAKNQGVFFNLTYDVTDQVTASFEGRYQLDDVSGSGEVLTGSSETEAFLPRFALTYTPHPDMTVYAQYARGNNPSGLNTGGLDENVVAAAAAFPNAFPAPLENITFYDEEEVDSFEIGMKGNYPNNFGTYSIGAYYLDWIGYVQPFNLNFEPTDFIDVDDDGLGDVGTIYEGLDFGPGRSYLTAGDASATGLEVETRINLTDELTLGLSGTYIDFAFADNACSTVPLDFGVPADATTAIGLPCVSVAGNEIGTQPKLAGAANFSWNRELPSGKELFARWNTRYQASQYVSEMNLAEVPAYSVTDIRAGLTSGAWRGEIYISNLFNDDTPQGPQYFFDGRVPGPPPFRQNVAYTDRRERAFGARLSFTFGR